MHAAAYIGNFVYALAPRLYNLIIEKTHSERTLYQDNKANFNRYLSLLELFTIISWHHSR